MKHVFALLSLFISLMPNVLLAQVTAGEVPPGYTLYESDLLLEIEEEDYSALNFLDVNFDGEDDLKFFLRKESIQMNGTHRASTSPEHDNIGICHDPEADYSLAELHEEGNLLECNEPNLFDLNPAFVGHGLGQYRGGSPEELRSQVSEQYLHYEWETETELFEGWIKVSFDLTTDVIFLRVHEWIVKDEISSTAILEEDDKIALFPNPVQNGVLYLSSKQNIEVPTKKGA